MTARGPIVEYTFVADTSASEEFVPWLGRLRDRAGLEAGIADVRGYETHDDAGNLSVTLRFSVDDDAALDELLDEFFAEADADFAAGFGEAVTLSSRVLREETGQYLPSSDNPNCLNCGTRLRGQYCGHCGQRARSRLISLWGLLKEAFGDLLEIDSRLWRTLGPLLGKPGQLTRDYLEGRRARYMPPFRTYLVLSVVFFVVAFFDPREDLSLLFEPEPAPVAEQSDEADEQREEEAEQTIEEVEARKDAARERIEELAAEGRITAERADQAIQAIDDNDDSGPHVTFSGDGDNGLNFDYDEETGECVVTGLEKLPGWAQRRLTEDRLVRICEEIGADGGKTFLELLLDNIPIALIVLLPLMALALKILYPLSRRYFVEHLLFFVHFHAFFFLILILQILYSRFGDAIGLPEAFVVIPIVATSFYIPVYLYKAMRRVYDQGHLLTMFKYVALVTTYSIGAMFTMLGAMLFALISI